MNSLSVIKSTIAVSVLFLFAACSNPQPGPDKTITGAVLGAGWGAGAGAVVGNQISNTGAGAAVGAGFGLVDGAMAGAGYDIAEGAMLRQKRTLASLKVQNMANRQQLRHVQASLDSKTSTAGLAGVYQVFFDPDATSLRAGAIANLEVIANSLQASTDMHMIRVVGHTDDSGRVAYNERLAEARARSVTGYLTSRGISSDQIVVTSHGAKRPIATNGTETGRQLNRRVDVYIDRK